MVGPSKVPLGNGSGGKAGDSLPAAPAPIVVIDNYDSFTYNLVQYLGEWGYRVEVFRNDTIGVDDVLALQPLAVVLSPGPGRPESAGITVPLVQAALRSPLPLLGVCLGHQAIGYALDGRIVQAPRLMHGKTSPVFHDGRTLFEKVPNPLARAGRYHSLCIAREGLPGSLEVSAVDDQECIMAVRHRALPIEGVQFHPESVLTPHGRAILGNFLALARRWRGMAPEPAVSAAREPDMEGGTLR